MITEVPVDSTISLADYAVDPALTGAVLELQAAAGHIGPGLRERTVWMVNSTAKGGGVAEMMPRMASILNQLGVRTRWLVIGTDRSEFFVLTKRIHNLVHGEGDPNLSDDDRALYESVSEDLADEITPMLAPEDILVVHDPQPLAMGAKVKSRLGLRAIWRCHIGLDERPEPARAVWRFLRPFVDAYDHTVFSAAEYTPSYVAGKASIIEPAIDPLGHKNRDLSPHQVVGVLCNAGLKSATHPIVTPPFGHRVQRLRPGRAWSEAADGDEIGLLYRPIVTQISRWDRLKGFEPLLDGFARLKTGDDFAETDEHRRRLRIVRLVLAGPDPGSVADDPEAIDVLESIVSRYEALPPDIQQDVAVLKLPMDSTKENALIVNALQRCSTIVVQNSLREGFGLTATEAMWKRVPIIGTDACGLRHQIRSGIDGVTIHDPTDTEEIARRLNTMLADRRLREILSSNARLRVHADFLIMRQLASWLAVIARHASLPPRLLDDEKAHA